MKPKFESENLYNYIREKKSEMENKIEDAISDFNDKTGLIVIKAGITNYDSGRYVFTSVVGMVDVRNLPEDPEIGFVEEEALQALMDYKGEIQ